MGQGAGPGWYQDPAAGGGLRYWDGKAWTDHFAAQPAKVGASRKVRSLGLGLVATVFGLAAFVVLSLLTVLTSNACGAFADGCEEYGETAPGFEMFAVGAGVSLLVVLAGAALLVGSLLTRSRPEVKGD